MFQVFNGYTASHKGAHLPLWPCVKLVCDRKVVSLLDSSGGYKEHNKLLRAARVDMVSCYVLPDAAQAVDLDLLWNAKKMMPFMVAVDLIRTSRQAIHWLLDPLAVPVQAV